MSDHRDKLITFDCKWGKRYTDEECKELTIKLLDLFENLPLQSTVDFLKNYKPFLLIK